MNELSIDQKIRASINENGLDAFFDEFEYKTLFLNKIMPDPSNPRYLPVVIIEDRHADEVSNRKITKRSLSKMYDAENKVMLGKNCMLNCLKYGSKDWKRANETIFSIMDLAQNINVSELIQAPTVYPKEDKYVVLTGHRRFFALIFSKGEGSANQFKVYKSEPTLKKIKQFQENSSRESLLPSGKLSAFNEAMLEAEVISSHRKNLGLKKLSIREKANLLGISMGAFDNYNVLVRYPSVFKAYESGLTPSFMKVKKLVIKIESEYKEENQKSVLNVEDKRKIDRLIEDSLAGNKKQELVDKNVCFSFPAIPSKGALETLLSKNIFEMDLGIDWNSTDWSNPQEINNVLKKVVASLE
jgi:hypothetical protein